MSPVLASDPLVSTIIGLLDGLRFHDPSSARTVLTYSPETVERIYRLFYDEKGYIIAPAGLHRAIASLVCRGASEQLISEALTYAPQLPYKSELNLIQGVKGLHYYRGQGWLPPQQEAFDPILLDLIRDSNKTIDILFESDEADDLDLPFGEHSESTPIVTHGIDSGHPFHTLSDERLIRLLWERHSDRKRITDIIWQRSSGDVSFILSILDSESPALSEGVL